MRAEQYRAARRAGVVLAASALVMVLLPLVARGQTVQATARPAISADERSQASELFIQRCAACHGDDGRGNGPAAGNLKPRPIDFHSLRWQKSVSDASITKAIIFGGRAVGLSGQMAPNPDLENDPAVVAALVEKIRKWGR